MNYKNSAEYSDLAEKLKFFYQEEVNTVLKEYEKERKEDIVPFMTTRTCTTGAICSVLVGIIFPPALILFVLFIVYMLIYTKILSRSNYSKIKKVVREDSTTYAMNLPLDYEMSIKNKLMPGFLKIFGEGFKWGKTCLKDSSKVQGLLASNEQIKRLLINLEKYFYNIDDVIENSTLPTPIKIMELQFNIWAYIIPKMMLIFFLPFTLFFTLPAIIFVYSSGYQVLSSIETILLLVFVVFPCILISLGIPIAIITILLKALYFLRHSRKICIAFDINKTFFSHTVIIGKKEHLKRNNETLEKVILEDILFKNKYNTFSNNQVDARYLLTTGFMARFEDIKTSFKAKNIRAEFIDGKLYLLIEVDKDLFQMGTITKETNFTSFKIMLDEIYTVLNLSEQLNLDSKTKI